MIDPNRLACAKPIIDGLIATLPTGCRISNITLRGTDLILLISPAPEHTWDMTSCHEATAEACDCVHRADKELRENAQKTTALPPLKVACVTKPSLQILKALCAGAQQGITVSYEYLGHKATLPRPRPEDFPDIKPAKESKPVRIPATLISGFYVGEHAAESCILLTNKIFINVKMAREELFEIARRGLVFEGSIRETTERNVWAVASAYRIGDKTYEF
ncbi:MULTISPECIES: hypothetical protein [Rhodanobacter]|uniref:hypothetical protein n=1 Tax=Rhodanobacter TaxID=75309 RepID=UPI00131EDEE1|nr:MULTISPECIES: hypothetical protein [Rhodanobacter]UJJ56842.1 hypothetical protein LRK55_09120 [Rhodanobacter denitrificans]